MGNSYKCFNCCKKFCYLMMTWAVESASPLNGAASLPTSPSYTSGSSRHASNAWSSTVGVFRSCGECSSTATMIHSSSPVPCVSRPSRKDKAFSKTYAHHRRVSSTSCLWLLSCSMKIQRKVTLHLTLALIRSPVQGRLKETKFLLPEQWEMEPSSNCANEKNGLE